MYEKTIWFIEPIGDRANRSLSDYFGSEAAQANYPCTDGKHDVYETRNGYPDIIRFLNSSFTFNFYRQKAGERHPSLWTPPNWAIKKKNQKSEYVIRD